TGDTLVIPIYIGLFSALGLASLALRESWDESKRPSATPQDTTHFGTTLADHVGRTGGATAFFLKLARLLGCFLLLGMSTASAVLGDPEGERTRTGSGPPLGLKGALCGVYAYAALLASAVMSTDDAKSRTAARHVNIVLCSAFCVYVYRDLFPLATFSLQPKDMWEGQLLWPQIAVLFV
ncbi:unnamed protein product, partial [Mycena citricolor]